MIAVRDNERGGRVARALAGAGRSSPRSASPGAIAGLAGGLLAGLLVQFEPARFAGDRVAARRSPIAVIGGLSSVAGAVLGALWVVGLPALFSDSAEVALFTSGVGLLILLLYFPGGLVQILYSVRDAAVRRGWRGGCRAAEPAPARAAAADARASRPGARSAADARRGDPGRAGSRVRFGSRASWSTTSTSHVGAGEVVGLIGANGAGKSTLMNAIGGFVPQPRARRVLGHDVAPALAGRGGPALGLGRSFQGAELFPDLTVRETVRSRSRRVHAGLVATMLGLPRAPRSSARSARRPTRSSPSSASARSPTASSTSCRPARAASSSSRASWRRARACCASTSRPPGIAQRETRGVRAADRCGSARSSTRACSSSSTTCR